MEDEEYKFVKKKIRDLVGIDLDYYKEKQMRRRLGSFMERNKELDSNTYFNSAQKDQQMLQELKDFLTINVSEFFRDGNQFSKLETLIMPELLQNRGQLKIWSAGCSNGSEPYTLAIMLEELSPGMRHKIVATDLDETILTRAKAGGPYLAADVRNVRPERLAKYFHKSNDEYWVTDKIKQKVEFKRHNLLSEPYESNCDLVLCRNVVIYFTDEAKRKIYVGFSGALKEGGILFIGGSEIIFDSAILSFEVAFPSFYRKVPAGTITKVTGMRPTGRTT